MLGRFPFEEGFAGLLLSSDVIPNSPGSVTHDWDPPVGQLPKIKLMVIMPVSMIIPLESWMASVGMILVKDAGK
ncbi:hypothetical protein L1987_11728 [Smallanthus sonchifolius]|uniref:Uncharacterized protein n=1 Tax=Smallanthus sonchifolius TaxID=185202 RepID=A0ACB9JBS9_9ASTR|nr:hypothetical protein L1987_11728 [Smallanthus sonchifolius]